MKTMYQQSELSPFSPFNTLRKLGKFLTNQSLILSCFSFFIVRLQKVLDRDDNKLKDGFA